MELNELVGLLFDAKKRENEAKEERTRIEEQIAALVETPENGSRTVPAGDVKITVKRGLNYKADIDAIRALELEDPPLKLVPAKYELDAKKYEAMRDDIPELAELVTTTPKKVAVEIKM